ncbi:MAG: TRAP transporter small permease subunit [Rhodocyclaceae bacterium]|jgi:TRAP-type mannitol/chloroaromatic compound transport system permease small subunit|nr:MAG: TRAP transporter small permease subunit [Rhodocyclaceae bacterium]
MDLALRLSRAIDTLNERIGRGVLWLVLVAVLISAGNAVMRKAFNLSSNAFLEVQWYLFSAIFLLSAGYTLLRDEHVRIDLISSRCSPRTRAWIDIAGTLLFLLPMSLMLLRLSWPIFVDAWSSDEMSGNAGGLLRWPVKLLMPAGFSLLALQGTSELIKRIAYLAGRGPDPQAARHGRRSELDLADEIARQRGGIAHD